MLTRTLWQPLSCAATLQVLEQHACGSNPVDTCLWAPCSRRVAVSIGQQQRAPRLSVYTTALELLWERLLEASHLAWSPNSCALAYLTTPPRGGWASLPSGGSDAQRAASEQYAMHCLQLLHPPQQQHAALAQLGQDQQPLACLSASRALLLQTGSTASRQRSELWLRDARRETHVWRFLTQLETAAGSICGLAWHPGERYMAVLTSTQVLVCAFSGRAVHRVPHDGLDLDCLEQGNACLTFAPCGTLLHVRLGKDRAAVLSLTGSPSSCTRAARVCASAPAVPRPLPSLLRLQRPSRRQLHLAFWAVCIGAWLAYFIWLCVP